MTEKERMLSGQTYNSRDPELLGRYHYVRKLLKRYRETPSDDHKTKHNILTLLLGSLAEEVWIEAPFLCDYGEQIHIGNHVFINYNCVFLDSNKITIGDHALIGPEVQIYTASHPINAKERLLADNKDTENSARYLTTSKPVTIGENTWIGGGAMIMPGVSIGHNTTIGAGSVVTASVPDNCFAAGNPCKIIKYLND